MYFDPAGKKIKGPRGGKEIKGRATIYTPAKITSYSKAGMDSGHCFGSKTNSINECRMMPLRTNNFLANMQMRIRIWRLT